MPRGVLAMVAAFAAFVALVGAPSGVSDSAPSGDLMVALFAPTSGQPGEVLTFLARITNGGPTGAPQSSLEFTFDSAVFAVSNGGGPNCAEQSPSGTTQTIRCAVPDLGGGSTTDFSFDLRVQQRSQTTVSATIVAALGTDPNTQNNSQSAVVFGPPSEFRNQSPPTVSGSASVGSTLTASTGTWLPDYDYAYNYHWLRCSPSANFCKTLNATNATYPLTADDAGCAMQVVVTASDGKDTHNEGSAQTAVVEPARTCDPSAGTGGSGGGGGGSGGGGPQPPPAAPTFSFVSSLPHPQQYRDYHAVVVTGTTHALRFTLIAGTLPTGIGLADGDYAINGIARGAGSYTFTIQATDLATTATAQHEFTLVVDPTRDTTSAAGGGANAVRASVDRTPGAPDPAVTSATIHRTICLADWTRRMRPPVSYTEALKRKQMRQYNEAGPASRYEEDHLIPLELGGAPRNPKNLWPEPLTLARERDTLERSLRRQVCARTLTLAAARKRIAALKHTAG